MTDLEGLPIQRELFESVPIVPPRVRKSATPHKGLIPICPNCGCKWTVRTSKTPFDNKTRVIQYMDCKCEDTQKREVSADFVKFRSDKK